jgi:hypothetical protein
MLVALFTLSVAAMAADGGGDGCEFTPSDVSYLDGGGAD